MHFFRMACVVALAASQVWFTAIAQSVPGAEASKAAPQGPSLRTTSNLVLVDVVVSNHDKPVAGLARARFHIFDNGREQSIVSFDEHSPAEKLSPPLPKMFQDRSAPHTFTNISLLPASGAINVLLLDGLNTPLANQMDVRRQMLEYMARIEPGTSLAIFTLSSRLRLVEGFTTDAAQLARALLSPAANAKTSALSDTAADQAFDSAIGDMASMRTNNVDPQSNLLDPIAAMQQFQADATAFQLDERVQMTMNAMQQLARYLSGFPGRKNLIWFSASFPLTLDPDDALQSPFQAMRNYSEQIRETSQLLATARVAVYPVDAESVLTPPTFDITYDPSTNLVGATSETRGGSRSRTQANRASAASDNAKQMRQNMKQEAALEQIAADTGGKVYIRTNGLREAVADAIATGSSYYSVGFSPAALDGHFHKLQLRLDNSSWKLAYRSGYFAEPPNHSSPMNPESSLVAATSLHGAPDATQILFEARVLDSSDPTLKGSRLPKGPAGELASTIRQPAARVIVDVKADAAAIALEQGADGRRSGKIEFVLVAYDADGKRLNYLDRGFQMSLTPSQYEQTMANGIPIRLALDLPPQPVFLRIAVHDLNSNKAGSIEVRYNAAPPR